ncbi:MAG: DUF2971 domain-containing protein [Crenarchaeota archaeon]|nr:DUF2971 domain-containing protein [Thermoproteota archaeon]
MQYEPQPIYLFSPAFSTLSIEQVEETFLIDWLRTHHLGENDQLYHYTTLSGLRGILTSRTLWLGHISSLNDRTEIQYGQEIADEILRLAIQRESSEDIRIFLQDLSNWIRPFAKQSIHHVFVACFCRSGNLLSQWREYSHRGQGYCLGFQFSAETRIVSTALDLKEGQIPFLRKVVYRKEEQERLINQYLSPVLQAVKESLKEADAESSELRTRLGIMAIQAANVLMDMVMCFKHPAFESEDEWRLVYVAREDFNPKGLEFRETDGQLTPYRPVYVYDKAGEAPLRFPIRSIRFGPTLEPDRTRSSLSLFVKRLASEDHAISLSPDPDIIGAGISLRNRS